MIILGIETSTPRTGIALGETGRGVLAEISVAGGRRHVETLVPAIELCCVAAGISLPEVRVIAADVGPGLYSGLRVGVASANALASSLGARVIGVSSLDLLAAGVCCRHPSVMAVLDARRGEVFYASYRVPGSGRRTWDASGWERTAEPAIARPSDVCAELVRSGREWLLVGDGAVRYEEQFTANPAIMLAERNLAAPSASVLVEMALGAHPSCSPEGAQSEGAASLRPLYLRPPDAKINWERHRSPGLAVRAGVEPAGAALEVAGVSEST